MEGDFDELVERIKLKYQELQQKVRNYMLAINERDVEMGKLHNRIMMLSRRCIPEWLDLNKFKLTKYDGCVYVSKTANIKVKYVSFNGRDVYKLNNQHPLGNLKICLRIDPETNQYEQGIVLKNGNPFKSFHTSATGICAPIPSVIDSNEKLEKTFAIVEDALNTVNFSSVYDPPYSINSAEIEKIMKDITEVAEKNNLYAERCEKCGYVLPTCSVPCIYCSYFRESEEDEEDEDEE